MLRHTALRLLDQQPPVLVMLEAQMVYADKKHVYDTYTWINGCKVGRDKAAPAAPAALALILVGNASLVVSKQVYV
jgi:hypothetical protein